VAEPRLRASLLIAGTGAVLVLIDVAGVPGALAGLGLIALGLLLSSPARRERTGELDWWRLLAAGAALVAVGIVLGLAVESLGGVLAAAGGVAVVIAVALGLP